MGRYVEARLQPGEQIIYQARMSRVLLVGKIFQALSMVFIFILVGLAVHRIMRGEIPPPTEVLHIVIFVIVLAVCLTILLFAIKYLYDYYKSEIAVTDKRIIAIVPVSRSIFVTKEVDLPLSNTKEVKSSTDSISSGGGSLIASLVAEAVIEYLADYGWVTVVDKNGQELEFLKIGGPNKLASQIREAAGIMDGAVPIPGVAPPAEAGTARRNWKPWIALGVLALGGWGLAVLWHVYGKDKLTKSLKTTSPAQEYLDKGWQEKDQQKKIELFTKAIDLDPKSALAFNKRGHAHYAKKEYDQALRDLDRAIELKPDYGMAFFNRGEVYYQQKRYSEAIGDYTQTIKLKPDYASAYNNRGNAYYRKMDYDRAIHDYHQAIKLKPDDAIFHSNRGNALYDKKDYDQALKDYSRAITLKPDYAWPYYRRAIIYNLKGDAQQARRDYGKAKSLNPSLPELVIK